MRETKGVFEPEKPVNMLEERCQSTGSSRQYSPAGRGLKEGENERETGGGRGHPGRMMYDDSSSVRQGQLGMDSLHLRRGRGERCCCQ